MITFSQNKIKLYKLQKTILRSQTKRLNKTDINGEMAMDCDASNLTVYWQNALQLLLDS